MVFHKMPSAIFVYLILVATARGVPVVAQLNANPIETKTDALKLIKADRTHKRTENKNKMDKCTGSAEASHTNCQPFSALDLMKEGSAKAQLEKKDNPVTNDPQNERAKAVGDAWLDDKGNLMLQMRRTSDGTPVHSLEKLVPGTKDYDEVFKHIGGIKPGEKKLVPPWTETM